MLLDDDDEISLGGIDFRDRHCTLLLSQDARRLESLLSLVDSSQSPHRFKWLMEL